MEYLVAYQYISVAYQFRIANRYSSIFIKVKRHCVKVRPVMWNHDRDNGLDYKHWEMQNICSSRRLFVQKLCEIDLACAKLDIAVFTGLTHGAVSRVK